MYVYILHIYRSVLDKKDMHAHIWVMAAICDTVEHIIPYLLCFYDSLIFTLVPARYQYY